MFTVIVILFVIIELMYVVNPKGMSQSAQNLIDANKENKDLKYNQYPEEYKQMIINGCLKAGIVLITMFGGLLTEQWVIWVSLLGFNMVLIGPLNKFLKKVNAMSLYYIVVWVNSLVGLGAGVFHIINDYHLQIDLYEYVQKFF